MSHQVHMLTWTQFLLKVSFLVSECEWRIGWKLFALYTKTGSQKIEWILETNVQFCRRSYISFVYALYRNSMKINEFQNSAINNLNMLSCMVNYEYKNFIIFNKYKTWWPYIIWFEYVLNPQRCQQRGGNYKLMTIRLNCKLSSSGPGPSPIWIS